MFDTSIRDHAALARREGLEKERLRVLARTTAALEQIRTRIPVREAFITGSLVQPGRWDQTSDVDVAVGGCSRQVLEVMRLVEDATGKPVDVIDLDQHPRPDGVRSRGVRIYG
jgi:predicted nucleotidyltransferase